MNDIVERLRKWTHGESDAYELMGEAAAEIEKLRGQIEWYRGFQRAVTPESETYRQMKDKIMAGMAKDLGVDHG